MAARGDPDAPLSDEELRAKFRSLAHALPSDGRAALERAVERLEDCGTLDESFFPHVLTVLPASGSERPPCIAATLG